MLGLVQTVYRLSSSFDQEPDFVKAYLERLTFLGDEAKDEVLDLLDKQLQTPVRVEKQLRSIFSTITLENKSSSEKPFWFDPSPLHFSLKKKIERNFFPSSEAQKDLLTSYKNTWSKLREALEKLAQIPTEEGYSRALYHLLSLFTSRIASQDASQPQGISLFDEFRIGAAKAICLQLNPSPVTANKPFLLIKGDLSGIQSFLYSQIDLSEVGNTANLAKRLRGRSFYISLLTDHLAHLFAQEMGLPMVNILYSGGGHFLIVAPNTPHNSKLIDSLSREVNLFLREKVTGRLGLVMGVAEGTTELFANTRESYKALSRNLNQNKYTKYKPYLSEIFYPPNPDEKDFKEDKWIGEVLPYGDLLIEVHSDKALKSNKLSTPVSYLTIGKRHTNYFIPKENEILDLGGTEQWIHAFLQEIDSPNIQSIQIHRINETKFWDLFDPSYPVLQTAPLSVGYKIIGNFAPLNSSGHVLDFEGLQALNSVDLTGKGLEFEQLGVMRLDVDNLGSLFARGFGQNSSFAQVACLSRELTLFFSAYVNLIAQERDIYITYSGGDDAFVIGSWLNTMHVALELRHTFRAFTARNPALSFSAGIYFCGAHYPVAKFAQQAAEEEKAAKKYNKEFQGSTHKKDALTVFGHTLKWDAYEEMLAFGQTLLKYIDLKNKEFEEPSEEKQKNISRAFVHRVYRLIKGSVDQKGKIYPKSLYRNVTQLHYLFAKQGYSHKKMREDNPELSPEEQELVEHVLKHFLNGFNETDTKNDLIKNYLIPTQYVLYKTRVIKNK